MIDISTFPNPCNIQRCDFGPFWHPLPNNPDNHTGLLHAKSNTKKSNNSEQLQQKNSI